MSNDGRFEAHGDGVERRGITIIDGRDRKTGLAVRIFRYDRPTRGAPDRIDHPNLPGVIALESEGGVTQLVNIAARGYTSFGQSPLDPAQVQAFTDALAALHAAGIVHGGLGPERLHISDDDGHVLIEGGGAPWKLPDGNEPSAIDDVRALASMLVATPAGLVAGQRIVLEDAAEGAGADDGVALSVAFSVATSTRPPTATDGSVNVPSTERTSGGGSVVKNLPPGGVYSSGEARPRTYKAARLERPNADETQRTRSRLPRPAFLLGLIAIIVVVIAYVLRPNEQDPPPVLDDPTFVVDVQVAPVEAPPLDIIVIDAPVASELANGSGLGRAPRRIQLDVPGRWVIEGRFGEQRTDPVTLIVPGPQEVTLTLRSLSDGDGGGGGVTGDGDAPSVP